MNQDDMWLETPENALNTSQADDSEEQAPKIEILYEDEHLVAIHKPAGLLVHRSYLARRERFLPCNLPAT